ncbi:MAG TPA: S8 family serine peptidase [Candidatus Thermoplasmatota archaeon]|nr:S8 family serine peptidase [Candidatus Thermoplasmatota archaeon]
MRRYVLLPVMLMLAPTTLAMDVPKPDDVLALVPGGDETIPDIEHRWIVGFHEMVDTSSGYYGLWRIVDESANLRFVTIDGVVDVVTFQAYAAADANVKYVEKEQWHHVLYTPSDPYWTTSDYTWGFKQIYANIAWDKTRGTTSAKVCVLDTGLYKGHQEFSGLSRILGGWDAVYEDSDPNDPHGHGTHVTGIIGAKINAYGIPGMAQSAIYPVRVLNAQGSGTTTDIAQGYDLCRTSGSHISSASLGGGSSTTIANAVAAYQNNGGLAIAAAGNDGCACVTYPAGYSGVIGVGASDKNNAKASFSNTGSHVDLVAPGVRIVSSYVSSSSSYVYMDGTSMATPFVSGVAALVKSYNTGLSASQIRDRLQNTAQDLGASGKDSSYGYGLVRADRAVY